MNNHCRNSEAPSLRAPASGRGSPCSVIARTPNSDVALVPWPRGSPRRGHSPALRPPESCLLEDAEGRGAQLRRGVSTHNGFAVSRFQKSRLSLRTISDQSLHQGPWFRPQFDPQPGACVPLALVRPPVSTPRGSLPLVSMAPTQTAQLRFHCPRDRSANSTCT